MLELSDNSLKASIINILQKAMRIMVLKNETIKIKKENVEINIKYHLLFVITQQNEMLSGKSITTCEGPIC